MSKIRLVLAGTVLSGLAGAVALVPAGAASADTNTTTTAATSSGGLLPLIVCLTIEPKSVTIDGTEIGPIGLSTTCVIVP